MQIAQFTNFSKEFADALLTEDRPYSLVPKGRDENLAFREWILTECENDDEFAELVWIACKRDILFFVNTFCWMKESREGLGVQEGGEKIFPWITWPMQDWLLTEMQNSLGKENVVLAKPRAAAASWCVVALFFHAVVFLNDVDFGMASAKEEKVDSIDDPSSLFGKIDVLLRYMPEFLLPKADYTRGPARFVNHTRHNTIIGYASTKDLNTGGRNTAFLMDEMGDFPTRKDYDALETMSAGVTNSVFLVSTFNKRRGCAFNVTAKNPKFPAKRLRVAWYDCPPQAVGSYIRLPGQPARIIDPTPLTIQVDGKAVQFPVEWPFVDDGQLRSPYFDMKSRGLSKQQIARQLLADEEGSSQQGIDRDTVVRLREENRKAGTDKPNLRGYVRFNREDYVARFRKDETGPLSIFCDFKNGRPPADDAYSLGVDISGGVGASNSVIDISSRSTGKQVAVYVSTFESPYRLARVAKALGLMFRGVESEALLNWDTQGTVGGQFKRALKKIGYASLCPRYRNEGKADKRMQGRFGYGMPSDGPGELINELVDSCDEGTATIYDDACYAEILEYVWLDDKIVHVSSQGGGDSGEGAKTHGDRAVARGLSLIGCQNRPYVRAAVVVENKPPHGSGAWLIRHVMNEDEQAAKQNEDEFNFA